ncbi:unnamed protein product [marine sediment metagenome]|uniref:Uncharacterized protein n=1 Tax=marine sediment metagenome TaxID=412755 RepID=X1FMC9_9ZZZZ
MSAISELGIISGLEINEDIGNNPLVLDLFVGGESSRYGFLDDITIVLFSIKKIVIFPN